MAKTRNPPPQIHIFLSPIWYPNPILHPQKIAINHKPTTFIPGTTHFTSIILLPSDVDTDNILSCPLPNPLVSPTQSTLSEPIDFNPPPPSKFEHCSFQSNASYGRSSFKFQECGLCIMAIPATNICFSFLNQNKSFHYFNEEACFHFLICLFTAKKSFPPIAYFHICATSVVCIKKTFGTFFSSARVSLCSEWIVGVASWNFLISDDFFMAVVVTCCKFSLDQI